MKYSYYVLALIISQFQEHSRIFWCWARNRNEERCFCVMSRAWVREKNNEFQRGIEPLTLVFRAPMRYHWATVTLRYARPLFFPSISFIRHLHSKHIWVLPFCDFLLITTSALIPVLAVTLQKTVEDGRFRTARDWQQSFSLQKYLNRS